MQCARCGAMLPVNASSCPVCAEPVANLVPQATPSFEPTLQAANQSAGAPDAPAPPSPASYGVFSFTEFGGAASSQAGQPPYSPMPAPGQFVPPGAAKKGPSVGIIIFSICLIVLLLGTGIAAFAYISAHSGKAMPNSQAIAQITPTVAPMQLYNQATSEMPVIDDSLAYPSASSWHNYQEPNYQCAFKNKAFDVSASDTRHFFYCEAHTSDSFTNFAFQVQMTILQGDYGGIVFREDPRAGTLYLFNIDQDGSYSLYVYPDNIGADAKTLVWGTALPFKTGDNQSNMLTVIAQGSHLYLYINAQFVAQATDTTLTQGLVGLAADDVVSPTEVAFSYAKLWTLSS